MKEKLTRKKYLKQKLLEHLKTLPTEKKRKINMNTVIHPQLAKGSFKDYLKGDLKETDIKILREVIFELKEEKVIYHIAGDEWVLL